MVDWNTLMGLVVLSAAVPLVYMHYRLAALKEKEAASRKKLHLMKEVQKDLEKHVAQDKALFLEALGVPFLLIRPSGRLVMANKAAGQLLGIDAECPLNLLHVLDDSEFRQVIRQSAEIHEPMEQMVQVGKGEMCRFYRTLSMPLNNAERHVGIVFHDVTELQRTQMIRRDFVANASHELRTPMTIIRGYLETLLDDPDVARDDSARTHALSLMKKHADRILRLVEDMLTLSRLETTERGYLRLEDFDLSEVVQEVRQRLSGQAESQGALLSVDIQPLPLVLHGDKFYWAQILFNLMENALKNNLSPGVRIEVQARRQADGSITLAVRDNGVGIAPEHLPYVFNRFYRADPTGKVKGTGLGLSIVRHAVEIHGGHIKVESEPGVMTAFTISLPAAEKEAENGEKQQPSRI